MPNVFVGAIIKQGVDFHTIVGLSDGARDDEILQLMVSSFVGVLELGALLWTVMVFGWL
jgi:hypothetical protein